MPRTSNSKGYAAVYFQNEALFERIKQVASDDDRSISRTIERILEEYFQLIDEVKEVETESPRTKGRKQ